MPRNPSRSSSPGFLVMPPLSHRPQQRQFWPCFPLAQVKCCALHALGLRLNVVLFMPLPKRAGLSRGEREGRDEGRSHLPRGCSSPDGNQSTISHLRAEVLEWASLVCTQKKEQLAAMRWWRGALQGRKICHCLLTSGGK